MICRVGERKKKSEPNNPFLSVKKTNNDETENPFLSRKKTEIASLHSLFSANLSQNNLFANVVSSKQQPEAVVHNKPKVLQKMFALSVDPVKNTFLFLNKLESDITFKVENQEFPALKSILSERCKFFKNMFASKTFCCEKILKIYRWNV